MTTPLYELKNLEMSGKLEKFLSSATAKNMSIRELSAALSEQGTAVSPTTVHRWLVSYQAGRNNTTKQRRR